MPSEPTGGLAPTRSAPSDGGEPDAAVLAFVLDAPGDATPRSAALALLRFEEYLGLLRRAGLDVCPTGPFGCALRAGLARVCRADGAGSRMGARAAGADGG